MKELLLLLALAGSHGADAYVTNRNINVQHRFEFNPVQRPFVHGTGWLIVAQGAQFGLLAGIQHKLRHVNGHGKLGERLADALLAAEIADHTNCAARSAVRK